jgi:predicted GIY-YIG superfamily endonuclease
MGDEGCPPEFSVGGLVRSCFVQLQRLRLAGQKMPRFYYVYELVSKRDEAIRYRGITRDLKARIRKHNTGGCTHTSKYQPWYIEVAVAFRSEHKARAFEKYLKTGSGREFSRRHF